MVTEVHPPVSPESSILVTVNEEAGTYWQIDYRYFDQYSLEELSVDHIWNRIHEATAADKLLRMNYDIHTGAILGLPGKILTFFASLPVTGFMVWWGRRKKESRKRAQSQTAAKKVLAVQG